ncbi:hypothetical protein [Paraclostridium bifermentans]|uniref:hypothetical protein n=1 Tax=Paraclostridium bifermentans TaxID=1490 RepID=UPI002430BF15|nr:hypothetical protein [Paraclostridium bifermentans]
MKTQVLDSNLNLFIEIDKNKLDIKDDGTSRIVVKSEVLEGMAPSILVLDFNQKHTQFIKNTNLDDKILFIQGNYQALKNKKEIPFVNVKVYKVSVNKKTKALEITKLRNRLITEFRNSDLKNLQEKYKELHIDEEIIKLREVIETKDVLKLKEKMLKQELTIKQIEARKLRGENSGNIKWYDNLNKEFIDIDINKIELKNEIFTKGKSVIDLKKLREGVENHVLVRPIDEEKYELVMGISAYLRARILNTNVKAMVTPLDRDTFIEQLNKNKEVDCKN